MMLFGPVLLGDALASARMTVVFALIDARVLVGADVSRSASRGTAGPYDEPK